MKDIIVVGAGLSGLNATLLLEEMGYSVTVIEGRDRVGGRVFSMDDVPYSPEGGADGIGPIYGRLIGAANRYGVELGPKRPNPRSFAPGMAMLNVDGQHIQYDEWADHPLNPLPMEHKERLPWQVQFGLLSGDNPIDKPSDFVDPRFAEHDISMHAYLRSKGLSERAVRLSGATNQSYGDAMGPHGVSKLFLCNVLAFGKQARALSDQGGPWAGKGGNLRIPEAMASNVQTDIRLNTRVAGIRHEPDHAEVHLTGGEILKAKHVIVTLPFSALRLIDLDAPITDKQSLAIRSLGYTNITHLSFVPKRAYWEDGLPANMWTDGPAGRVSAYKYNPDNPDEVTSIQMTAGGAMANYLDRIGPAAAQRQVLDYLARIRPSTKDAFEFVKFWSWQLDPFAGGSYAAWKPGQLSTYGKDMAAPAGRIHFAGEHTSTVTRGMEAAMESGERVAFEVAERL